VTVAILASERLLHGDLSLKLAPRILVIEDDPLVADLFRELLPAQSYLADVVGDAETGLEHCARQHYDLVISDKNLPGLSGIDLLKRVKAIDSDIDVIIMTAYPDMQSVLAALEAGVYDYLAKPFESIDEVMAKIARALDKRRIVVENRRLVDYLTQANAQIEGMNRGLEAEVHKRTAELKEANARLEQLSLTDDVTGLYNQRFLYGRLGEELLRARRYGEDLSILMLDVDAFKNVNDSHDHQYGSLVLRQLGDVFRKTVRATDFVVRYGGDEFVVLMPRTRLADALHLGERLRAATEAATFGVEGDVCKVTISIGAAARRESASEDAATLLRAADKAMYQAKAGGRNRLAVMQGERPVVVVAGIG